MTPLTWRSAVHADRQLLHAFECAEKGTRSARTGWKATYPHPWEHEVQSACRVLRPPVRPPRHLLVGIDDDGQLAALSYRTEVSGPSQVHLELMAVAMRHRRAGVGDQLVIATLSAIADRAVQEDQMAILVSAHVHPENKASQSLCERHEFARTGTSDSGYEVWSGEVYIV